MGCIQNKDQGFYPQQFTELSSKKIEKVFYVLRFC